MKISGRSSVVALLSVLVVSAPLAAQLVGGRMEALYTMSSGEVVAAAGDINADGVPDLLVGDSMFDAGALSNAGIVRIYSGSNGRVLWFVVGAGAQELLGLAVAGVGDVDADGRVDFAVSAPFADPGGVPNAGSVYVHSGRDGSRLWRFDGQSAFETYGRVLGAAGDVDRDGHADVLVGSPFTHGTGGFHQGVVDVYSGRDGNRIWRLQGGANGDALGSSVVGLGDVDGDGHADFGAGALEYTYAYAGTREGYFDLYSGRDGARIWRVESPEPALFGIAAASAGDIDGDGVTDVIVGAQSAQNTAGAAEVLSGVDGRRLRRWNGEQFGDLFGSAVSGAGDIDQDGVPDLLIGAVGRQTPSYTPPEPQHAYLFSGRDGSKLWQLDRNPGVGTRLLSVAAVGDIDGDGFVELAIRIGSPVNPVSVWRRNPFMTASMPAISAATGGTVDYALGFPASAAGDGYLVLMSASGTGPFTFGVSIPLTVDPLMVASATGVLGPLQTGFAGVLSSTATASASLALPAAAIGGLAGIDLHLAAIAFPAAASGGAPTLASAAIRLRIVP